MNHLRSGTRKARKQHRCEGFDHIDNFGWGEVKQAGATLPPMPHAIWPGEEYHFQITTDGGELVEFKSCKHCYQIICDQDLYSED